MCRAQSATCRENRHFAVTSGQKQSLGGPGSFASTVLVGEPQRVMTEPGDSKPPMVVAGVDPTGAGSHVSSTARPSLAGEPVAVVATVKPCVGSAPAPQTTNDVKTPPVESKKRPVPTAASDSSNGDGQPEPRKAARTLFPAEVCPSCRS